MSYKTVRNSSSADYEFVIIVDGNSSSSSREYVINKLIEWTYNGINHSDCSSIMLELCSDNDCSTLSRSALVKLKTTEADSKKLTYMSQAKLNIENQTPFNQEIILKGSIPSKAVKKVVKALAVLCGEETLTLTLP